MQEVPRGINNNTGVAWLIIRQIHVYHEHFILCPLSSADVLRRIIGVVWIAVCVIVGGFTIQNTARREKYGFLELVKILPVKVPFRNIYQMNGIIGCGYTVGPDGCAYQVHMRHYACQCPVYEVILLVVKSLYRIGRYE